MTEDFFKYRFLALLAAFPNSSQRVTKQTQAIYWQMLGELSELDFEIATRACINQCRIFPTVAEIRERVPKHVESFKALPPPGDVDLERGRIFIHEFLASLNGAHYEQPLDADTLKRREERRATLRDQAKFLLANHNGGIDEPT